MLSKIVCCLTLYWLVARNTVECSARTGGAVIEYEFDREECLSGLFHDTSIDDILGGISRHRTTTKCTNGVGVTSASTLGTSWLTRSRSDISRITSQLSANTGYTIELWIQPDTDAMASNSYRPIFTIGSNDTICSHESTSRILSHRDNKLSYELISSEGIQATAMTAIASTASKSQTHIAIVEDSNAFSLYVNGSKVFGGSFSGFDLDSSHIIQFFTNCIADSDKAASKWSGTVYYFAMYTRMLSISELNQNIAARLRNSAPVVWDVKASVLEDGERGSHRNNPKWYQVESEAETLARINLAAVDIDDDPAYINFDPSKSAMKVYLLSLPPSNEASLYNEVGDAITNVPELIPVAEDGNYSVRIRPAWNSHSPDPETPFTNFSFYAVDGVTGAYSNRVGQVSVIVNEANDPAIGNGYLNATVFAGKKTILPRLHGNAVENGDSVVRAYISRLPRHGNLYFANKTSEGSKAILDLSLHLAVGSMVELPHGSFFVAYKYTSESNKKPVSDDRIICIDSFGFRLLDEKGDTVNPLIGVERNYTIYIKSALEACFSAGCPAGESAADAAQSVLEDSTTATVNLYGYDYSDLHEDIKFVILELPSHGIIVDPDTGEQLSVDDEVKARSSYPYSSGIKVIYIPEPDYFNFPMKRFNGSFLGTENDNIGFQALPANTSSSATASIPVSMQIQVRNINDAPELSNTTSSFLEVYAFSYTLDDSDDTTYATSLNVPGIKIYDVDHDVDVVVIYITAKYGQITLNPAGINQVDFSGGMYSACFVYSQWQCKGDGHSDSTMRFVGQPSDINRAISNLEYRSTKQGTTDTILISVYDGDGTAAGCFDGGDLDETNCCSDRSDGCFVSSIKFSIQVNEYAIVASMSAGSDCDDDGWACVDSKKAAIIAGGFLLLFLCCCCACLKRLCCKAKSFKNTDSISGTNAATRTEKLDRSNERKPSRCSKMTILNYLPCCHWKETRKNEEFNCSANPMLENEGSERYRGQKRSQKDRHKNGCTPNPFCRGKPSALQSKIDDQPTMVRPSVIGVLKNANLSCYAKDLLELGICESDDLAQCTDEELHAIGMTMVEIRRLRRKLNGSQNELENHQQKENEKKTTEKRTFTTEQSNEGESRSPPNEPECRTNEGKL